MRPLYKILRPLNSYFPGIQDHRNIFNNNMLVFPETQTLRAPVLGMRAAVPREHRAAAVDDGQLLQRGVLQLRHPRTRVQRRASRRTVGAEPLEYF